MRLNFNLSSKSTKVNEIVIFSILTFFSVAISFVIAKTNLQIGALLLVVISGLPIAILLLTNVTFGFFSVLIISFFISYIRRLTGGAVPILVIEIMMLMSFTAFLIKQIRENNSSAINMTYLKNPVTIAVIIWMVYIHLQLLNPNSYNIMGKLIAIRFSWYNFLGYILALHVFSSMKIIKLFFKIVLGLSIIAALYGLSQKHIGLLPYDHEWLYSSEEHILLGVIWGRVRAWSFLNDPSNFGLLMSFSSVISLILILGPYSTLKRVLLASGGVLMLLAMVASGTRTAFVMVTLGFAIFALLTLNNVKTVLFSVFVFMVFMIIYFGPFYSPAVQRIRTAFQGNEDASMNVRSKNKARIQPYIWSHPIGGGPGTTGEEGKLLAPGHPLSGFPPDSGFLEIGLEFGYIGLLILLWQYFAVSSYGLKNYFRSKNYETKILYTAVLASFIALCSANLTQLANSMRPFDFFSFAYFAIIIKLAEFDSTSSESEYS